MSGDQGFMAFGRIRADEQEEDRDDDGWPEAKRMRQTVPSFISIIRGAMAAEKIQKLGLDLEPFFRKAVQEELERSLSKHGHLLYRSPPMLVNSVNSSPSLKLAFAKPLLLPIFTNNKLVDVDSNPLQVHLLHMNSTTSHHLPMIKLEVLVLDGDFRHGDENWSSDEFSGAIVRERQGRRPLLVGTLNVTMADDDLGNGVVAVIDDVVFTDNSSWIRSRRFRIGVRAMAGSGGGAGLRIREAVSESFMVKDHRGESYKKHFPPRPADAVWRLKNIRKDGPIHKRLESERVRNVQGFLNLHATNPEKLRKFVVMSDRLWKATLQHAKTCDFGAAEMMQVKQCSIEAYHNRDQLEEAETSKAASGAEHGQMKPSNLDQPHEGSLQADEIGTLSGPYCECRNKLDSEDSLAAAVTEDVDDAVWSPCMTSDGHGLIMWNSNTSVWDQMD
uniref:Calmodulin-binding protein-like n=1 Tax=Oryza punctata TaxID=4537 RepID=A0A0E0LZM2_ORYPU